MRLMTNEYYRVERQPMDNLTNVPWMEVFRSENKSSCIRTIERRLDSPNPASNFRVLRVIEVSEVIIGEGSE